MNILIACEYSGIVSEAFEAFGHHVVSCDLLPTERKNKDLHYRGNVLDIINNDFDLMIGHPPCTFLSFAGIAYFNVEKYGEKAIRRADERKKAIDFFLQLWEAPIKHICLENPKGYIMQELKQSQIIHPYYFGDRELKGIYLWLKNLPPLIHTSGQTLFEDKTHVEYPTPHYIDKNGKKRYITDSIDGTSKTAQKQRSRFFKGIANAMALQWTEYIENL